MRPQLKEARRVRWRPGEPLLVEGPVEVEGEDGTLMRSDRPVVALCMCRRSRSFPWCDTSHRAPAPVDAPSEQDSGRGDAQ